MHNPDQIVMVPGGGSCHVSAGLLSIQILETTFTKFSSGSYMEEKNAAA
jgi:uncharacterized membrane protein YjjB (DUF3815 family)